MRCAVLVALTGLVLSGCLEAIDPISNIDSLTPAGNGSGSVTLHWQPPTENADGSPLTDLTGYNIYVGTSSGSYRFLEIQVDNPGLTAYVVENLEPGTYYIAATAFNSSGVESAFSGEIVKTVN